VNTADHQHVPVGTVADRRDNRPVTLARDYDVLMVPEMEIHPEQVPALRQILDDYERDAQACREEMAEDADDTPGTPEGDDSGRDRARFSRSVW
jgi:hypothetical protein